MSFDSLIDPTEVRDYTWDWSARLASDTITAHTVTVTGCTLGVNSHTATTVTAWVSAASTTTKPTLTCHITTVGGRQYDDTISLIATNL